MFAEVTPKRHQGRSLPRWQLGAKLRRGILRIGDVKDAELRRTLKTARLVDEQNADLLLPLRDVVIVACRNGYLALNGFEAHEGITQPTLYHQSWIVQPLSPLQFQTWRDHEKLTQAQ